MQKTETAEISPALSMRLRAFAPLVGIVLMILIALWNLEGPPMWWDEGWTLSVARTWLEHGNYGRLLDGKPAPPGLEAAWPIVGLTRLWFEVFGIGIWQGRLTGAMSIPVALVAILYLTQMVYSRRIAWGATTTLLLLSMHPQLNLLIQGRQVLGEVPMLACLTVGYICLFSAVRKSLVWSTPAILSFAAAITIKFQSRPFFACSLLFGIIIALLLRRWRVVGIIGAVLLATFVLVPLLNQLWFMLLSGHVLAPEVLTGLFEVSGFVPSLFNRGFALSMALMFGLTTMLGLGYAAWKLIADLRKSRELVAERSGSAADILIMRATLLGFAGSWFAWFLLLSVGVPRYMFPVTFVGSIFVAVLLHDLTHGYRFFETLQSCTQLLQPKADKRRILGALLAVLLIAATLPITLLTLNRYYLDYSEDSAQQLAAFLNNETPPNTRIETYESELHFLLNRPYHWPPDQIHVELNRRSLLGLEQAVDYDPLASDPDYLIVGVFARGNNLYQPVIDSGAFRLLRSYGDYDLYQRVR